MTRRLTLTFDNGPWPGATEHVLDFLGARGLNATFFVVGKQIEDPAARALVERAWSEGHWIGNHTFTHSDPLGRSGGIDRVTREIGDTQERISRFAHPRRFFRPNGAGEIGPHLLSPEALAYLRDNRFMVVTWTSAPGDWRPPHTEWVGPAQRDVLRDPWTVLVLHDRFIAPQIERLAEFLDWAEAEGVETVQEFPESCLPVENGVMRASATAITEAV